MQISLRKPCMFLLFLISITIALPALAQQGTFRGKVTDDKGQPIVGASVTIQSTEIKSRVYTTKTDKKGEYVHMGIPIGLYRVVVRAQGFRPDSLGNLRSTFAEDTVTNFKLNPGEDHKLPFEMSEQELEQLKAEAAKMEKRKQLSAEVQAAFNAGLQLAQQGKHTEAIEEFKKALEKDPEQPNILANMAESYAKLDKNAEGLELYQKAIGMSPNDANLYTNMGVILNKMGKRAESQEAFKKAASLNPASAAQNFYNLGATLVNSGDSAGAAEAFKQAIAADSNFAEAYYQLGMCLSGKQETMADAIKALQTYVKIGKKPDQIDVAKAIITTLEQALKK